MSDKQRPQIGRNHHRLFNVLDPDGTRSERMQLQPGISLADSGNLEYQKSLLVDSTDA